MIVLVLDDVEILVISDLNLAEYALRMRFEGLVS